MKELAITNQYGNVDLTRTVLNHRYVHVEGKRLQPLCLKLKIKYTEAVVGFKGSSRYGYKPIKDGVVVSAHSAQKLLDEIDARIKRNSPEKRERARKRKQESNERRLKKEKIQLRQNRIAELSNIFPKLDADVVESLIEDDKSVYSVNDVGYQYGVGTKTYWNQLGFRVAGEPTGCLVRGKCLFATYSKDCLTPKRSHLTVEQLKDRWLKKYRSKELVLVQAIRFANRIQKVRKHPEFYSLKDKWLNAHQEILIDGRVARLEQRQCWSCDGTGTLNHDDECWKCDGSGIYSSRKLYEHHFEIQGDQFCFHSYVCPRILNEEAGADKNHYGRPFSSDELPLPSQSVIIALIKQMMLCK